MGKTKKQSPEFLLTKACALVILWASACGSPTQIPQPNSPGPGVIFSYPRDGQYDVPLNTRVLLTFSESLAVSIADGACVKIGDEVTGTFCVEGPDGFVQGTVIIDQATLAFTPNGGFSDGATYRVYANPALLPKANNLTSPAPQITFRARNKRTHAGEAATVVAVNGSGYDRDESTAVPLLDAAPIRLLFSEPLDPNTVSTNSIRLIHVADSQPVDGLVIAKGINLTFQPANTLSAGDEYELQITDQVLDRGAEQVANTSLRFTAIRTAAAGEDLYHLSMSVDPAWSDGVSQPISRLGVMPVNTNVLFSQLVGTNVMGVLGGGFDFLVGNPKAIETSIPMIVPRGQRLDLSSMQISYGGAIDSGMQTGTIQFTLLTDGVGMLMRNPFRGADQGPDDGQSPIYLRMMMDAVMSSKDSLGNILSTQTVMGLELLGLAAMDGDQLVIDQVGALDSEILGIDVAPINLAMRFRTGSKTALAKPQAPCLISSFPANGAARISPEEVIELNFDAPLDPARIRDGFELKLMEGATVVPVSSRLEGATLIITPSRRLRDGAMITFHYSGLRSMGGANVANGELAFTIAASLSGQAAPPIALAIYPGAPCAMTGGGSNSPGHCRGGKSSDSNYQPFALPLNRDVRVHFSQPIDPASLVLGKECGKGSFRVEKIDAIGKCSGTVPGWLMKRDREVRFLSNTPWIVGAAYRLTLVGGSGNCSAGRICGRNGKPLNTEPLAGVGANAKGGPDLVIDYAGTPATLDSYLPLASDPVADLNGNGILDVGEQPNDKNRVVMEVSDFGGIVTKASISGSDCLPDRPGKQACSYLNAVLPASIGRALPNCPIDTQGQPSNAPNPCIEVRVYPNSIIGTSTSTNSTVTIILPIGMDDLATGTTVMRLRETDAPIYGYIMKEKGVSSPVYVIRQEMYFDAPDLSITAATHDQKSKPISVTLKGPITFRSDGKMEIALRNIDDVIQRVNISTILGSGYIDMRIPAKEMRVTLAGGLLR